MRPVRSIILRGRRFAYEEVAAAALGSNCNGDTTVPPEPQRIRVWRGLVGKAKLEIQIHEMLHGCQWDLSEETIDEMSHDIARALWRLGYRAGG